MKNKEQLSLEIQYQIYLRKVSMKESEMNRIQKKQLRQTFMAAAGQTILLLRDEVGSLPEKEAIGAMEYMLKQVTDFFNPKTEHKPNGSSK